MIQFAGFLKDFLWLQVLFWRDVLGVKWTVITHVSVLDALELLVAVLRIFLIKFVKETLFNRYFVFLLLRGIYSFSADIKIDL